MSFVARFLRDEFIDYGRDILAGELTNTMDAIFPKVMAIMMYPDEYYFLKESLAFSKNSHALKIQ